MNSGPRLLPSSVQKLQVGLADGDPRVREDAPVLRCPPGPRYGRNGRGSRTPRRSARARSRRRAGSAASCPWSGRTCGSARPCSRPCRCRTAPGGGPVFTTSTFCSRVAASVGRKWARSRDAISSGGEAGKAGAGSPSGRAPSETTVASNSPMLKRYQAGAIWLRKGARASATPASGRAGSAAAAEAVAPSSKRRRFSMASFPVGPAAAAAAAFPRARTSCADPRPRVSHSGRLRIDAPNRRGAPSQRTGNEAAHGATGALGAAPPGADRGPLPRNSASR